LNKKVAAPGL